MKKLTLIGIYCLLAISAQGQVAVRLAPGYGIYGFSDLKKFHNYLIESAGYPVSLTTTDHFPNYGNAELSVIQERRKHLLGLTLAIGESGARSGYRDYSGSITIDETARFFGLFVNVGWLYGKEGGNWRFELDLRPGFLFNALDISEIIQIGNTSSAASYTFKSLNLVTQPTVVLTRGLGLFSASLLVGYQITILPGKLSLKGNNSAVLSGADGKPVTADWAGFRLAIGIGYRFGEGTSNAVGTQM